MSANYESNMDEARKIAKEIEAKYGHQKRVLLLAAALITIDGILERAKSFDDALEGVRVFSDSIDTSVRLNKGYFDEKDNRNQTS